VTTATYQASVAALSSAFPGVSASMLMRRGVQLAREACELYATAKAGDASNTSMRRPLVAASLGPYGANLADGSEYTGSYRFTTYAKPRLDEAVRASTHSLIHSLIHSGRCRSKEQLQEHHLGRLEAVLEEKPDVLALETLPCVWEATELLALIDRLYQRPQLACRPPCFVSFSCSSGGQLASGESITDAVLAGMATTTSSTTGTSYYSRHACARATKVLEYDCVIAIGVNCCAPQLVASLLGEIRRTIDGWWSENSTRVHSRYRVDANGKQHRPMLLCYPNSGERWNASSREWEHDPEYPFATLAEALDSWVTSEGAALLGGCCRVAPART